METRLGVANCLALVLMVSCLKGEEPPAAARPLAAPVVDLDKTYRLEFKLDTSDGSQTYVAITSQSVFKMHYGARKDGDEYTVDFEGTLAVCDGNRLRVSFQTALERGDANGDGFDLSSTGSAIVAIGKPRTVASYGEYLLKLTVTAADDQPPAAPKDGDKTPAKNRRKIR
jgi:hypothetical protein